mgnify:CR=1 FL=1
MEELVRNIRQEDSMTKTSEENISTHAIVMVPTNLITRHHKDTRVSRANGLMHLWLKEEWSSLSLIATFAKDQATHHKNVKQNKFPSNIRRPQAHIVEEFKKERNDDYDDDDDDEEQE